MAGLPVDAGPPVYGQYLGGHWRAADSGRLFADHDPWSGDVVAQMAAGGPEDARLAVEFAHDALPA